MISRAMVLTLVLSSPLFAGTCYVDVNKGADTNSGALDAPWKTLAKANAAVAPGDTVFVRGGVYVDSIIAPAASGAENAPIVYAAYQGETPEVTGGRSGSIINLHNKSYVIVKGFKIHSATEHDWIVNLSGEKCTHNRIENCDVTDPEGYVCIDMAEGASYNEIVGNVAHDTGHAEEGSGDCIVMNSGAHHNVVRGNKCFNACHAQIMALKGSKYNVIENNDLYATDPKWSGAGVGLPLGADYTTIAHNRIHDLGFITNEKCGIQIDSANNSVHHNLIYNVGAFGISPQSYAYGGTGQSAENNLIANNTIYHPGRQGLCIISKKEFFSHNNRIINNIVVASDSKWYDKPAYIMVFDTYHLTTAVTPGTWFDNVFKNNIFYHRSAGEPDMVLYNFKTGSKSWSLAELQKEFSETFAGNIEADPLFVGPSKGDFTLKPGSPAIDAGLDAGFPFNGKAPDLGALESPSPPLNP